MIALLPEKYSRPLMLSDIENVAETKNHHNFTERNRYGYYLFQQANASYFKGETETYNREISLNDIVQVKV